MDGDGAAVVPDAGREHDPMTEDGAVSEQGTSTTGRRATPAPTDAPTEVADLASPEGLGFRDALVWRRWSSTPPSRARAVTVCLVLALAIPLHVAVLVVADNPWSLLAVVLNPVAIYTYLWGWGHVSAYWIAVAAVLAVAGTYLPFHLM